jgi:hypothetical protein
MQIYASTKQSMFMQNFSSLAYTQTDLDKFLTFFKKNFDFSRKVLKLIKEIIKSEYADLCVKKQRNSCKISAL